MTMFLDIFLVFLLIAIIYLILIYLYNHRFIASDKRIAIDYLPMPVYFGLGNKLPLVVNDKMYELVYNIKGSPLTDMRKDFECLYERKLALDDVDESLRNKYSNSFFIKYNDRIYCIEERLFANETEKFIQINSQDITEEYLNLCKLKELNEEIKKQNERLQSYINNSIEINRQQELLDAKISIHGKFGDCLAMTRHLLKNPEDKDLSKKVSALWQQIIVGFSAPASSSPLSQNGYEELQRVSKMVGCKILVEGTLPTGAAQPIMLKLLREALNNAIRHANANTLFIDVKDFSDTGAVTIYDDGTPDKPFTKMGGGLSSLMENLEKNGILMNISNEERFEIHLNFPKTLRS